MEGSLDTQDELGFATALGESFADALGSDDLHPEVLDELSPHWGYELVLTVLGAPLTPERLASVGAAELEQLRAQAEREIEELRVELAPEAPRVPVTAAQIARAMAWVAFRWPSET